MTPLSVIDRKTGTIDRVSTEYFCAPEAMQNVAKYADAGSASVLLSEVDGRLVFEIQDDGRGFDAGTTTYGTRLQGMADRLDAIGGTLDIRSTTGEGTWCAAKSPWRLKPDAGWRTSSLAASCTWNVVTDFGPLDITFEPSGTRGYADVARDAVRLTILGAEVGVASLADVIRSKEAAGREKDRLVLPVLRRILEETERAQAPPSILGTWRRRCSSSEPVLVVWNCRPVCRRSSATWPTSRWSIAPLNSCSASRSST